MFRVYDGAGLVEHEAFDVDGNLVRQSRRLAAAYATTPDRASLDELDDPAYPPGERRIAARAAPG